MELNDMTQHIDELHAKRDIKALKNYLNELNPADIAQLLEEIEDERKRIFFFRLLTKENAAETFVEFDSDTQENLISAFSDREKILSAYRIAVEEEYRFFSFGDAMYIH